MQKKTFISFFILSLLMCIFCVQPKVTFAENYEVKNLVVSCIGDSIVYGYDPENGGAQLENNFPFQLSQQMNTTVNNYGVSGYNTTYMFNHLDTIKTQLEESDVIVMCIGANDILLPAIDYIGNNLLSASEDSVREVMDNSINGFEDRYSKILDWFRDNGINAEILLMNVYCPYGKDFEFGFMSKIPVGTITNDYLAGYVKITDINEENNIKGINNYIEEIANSYVGLNLHYIDIYSAFNSYEGEDKLVYAKMPIKNTSTDLDPHPTEKGHTVIADTILAKIREIAIDGKSDIIKTPTIECTKNINIFVPKFTTANIITKNIANNTNIDWFVDNEKVQTNGLEYNFITGTHGNYEIYARVNGIKSNIINLEYLNASVQVLQSEADINNNNCVTISFKYNVPEDKISLATAEMESKIYAIFEQGDYFKTNNYTLVRQKTTGEIKYYVEKSGAHKVVLVEDVIEIQMPYLVASEIAKITANKTEFEVGDSIPVELTFSFDGVATEKKWLWKTPERSAMEYINTEQNEADLSHYTINMLFNPGVYQFAVQYKSNNQYFTSEIISITVKAKPIDSTFVPNISQEDAMNTKNKINAFRFKVTNLGGINPSQVIWRVNGVQAARGTSFLFEPDFVDTYVICAEVNNVKSNTIVVDAVINNTLEKILIVSGVVVFLSILLAISIVVSIRKEKVW